MNPSKKTRRLFHLFWFCTSTALAVSCSDAVTPIPFDAGVEAPDVERDQGERDEPCFDNNTCENQTLVCVTVEDENFCRLLCTPGPEDPCGEGQTCRLLDDDSNACLPN